MGQTPRTIKLGGRLEALVQACEKACVAECCGIIAFDFSPLHMASHLSAYTGGVSEADAQEIEKEIDALAARAGELVPDENGFICSIDITNQYFTRETLEKLIHQLRVSLRLAPKVLAFADELMRSEWE